MEYIKSNIQWSDIRENEAHRSKQIMMNQGIPAASASLETSSQSGTSKEIDEKELKEQQLNDTENLRHFMLDTLENMRLVYNYHTAESKLNEKGIFVVSFSDEEIVETESDKKTRREEELKFGLKSIIDFYLEENENVSRDSAVQIIAKNFGYENYESITEEELLIEYNNRKQLKENPKPLEPEKKKTIFDEIIEED